MRSTSALDSIVGTQCDPHIHHAARWRQRRRGFTVSLDTYLDKRTAYSFSLSSGAVRGDFYHSQDSEDSGREAQFDPCGPAARASTTKVDGRDAHTVLAASLQRRRCADMGTAAHAQRRRPR
jgi:hypothetical protein